MKEVTTTLVILITASFVAGNCILNQIHAIGPCSFRVVCINTIKDIRLDSECQGSSNYDVKVDVTLQNASETFHIGADAELLAMITTLSVHGNWPRTDLSFLEGMYRLRNLYIINNNIQQIVTNNIEQISPFWNLVSIEIIDLSHNRISNIGELFQFEIRPSKMRSISLAYNSIVEVPGDTFGELSSLIELDLSHNSIMELREEPFCNLTHLKVLRLNNNKIKYLNGALKNLYNLRHLYLKSNQIQKIDMESINTINHLETFDISKNLIEKIDPTLFPRHWEHFSNGTIFKILLSDNYITHVPNVSVDIFERFRRDSKQMFAYTKLDLSNNSITHIEYNAFSLLELISVDLSNNKLTDFIVNPKDLIYVRYLNLSGNFLNRLYYESFSSMHSLHNFDLSHNYMEYFPDQSLSNIHNLKYLNLTFNDILELHSLRITFHPEGGYLDLSNNGLSALIIPENEAIGLRELVLSHNNISDAYLIRLTDQHDLKILDMSHNYIMELDESSLQLPEKLGVLDLSSNDIYRIAPSTFSRMTNLQTLRLSHNHLKTIDHGVFRGPTSLLNLDLSFNQIGQLDSKVFMDLQYLSFLSLRHNGLNVLDTDAWLSSKQDLTVYLDGNHLSCQWLAKALTDFNRGYSKMNPTVLETVIVGTSIQGIPCEQEVQNYEKPKYLADERLLITSQKILEAVQEQTSLMKRFMWHAILHEAEQRNARNVSRFSFR
ncbi:insulin-like growth factor-binding protein complex acid labile subunit [Maniola jurtina]|uniref:insulin-like growth factor-binding protein complex acid labile subunit n=1 Tax=Maniola jurtina TaxID=191418 RepID=UPI001E685F68|nr:insulin-like growth factor-binding protein complex acid labile subunit [Maniola jurtina]